MIYRRPSPWLDGTLDARMAALVAQKRSAGDIGRELGISRNAVIGRTHRTGLQLAPRPGGNPNPVRKRKPRPAAVPVRAVPKLKPPPKPVVRGTVELFNLEWHQCRWPFGEGPFLFCGERKTAGSYCFAHNKLSSGRA